MSQKIDIEQFIKILSLTQSDNDNEALAAIRRANAILNKTGSSWNEIITVVVKEKSYRYKTMPEQFDRGWFNSTLECKDFTCRLNQDQIDWVNRLIRFVNKHRYLPYEAWTEYRELWHNFREVAK